MAAFQTTQSFITMFRRVASARGRRLTGLYSIEGARLVERALRADAPLEAVLMSRRMSDSADARELALRDALASAGCPIFVASDSELAELTEGRDLGSVLGLVRLPAGLSLADVLVRENPEGFDPEESAIFLGAVNVIDPGNVGALSRTAHAAGARALLTTGASDPFHPRATRISRGSVFKLPVIHYASNGALLSELRDAGITTVAASAIGGISLPDIVWPSGGVAILMGNEADGLPVQIQREVDMLVSIPMAAGVDSFSVNAAAAIILYECRRERGLNAGPHQSK